MTSPTPDIDCCDVWHWNIHEVTRQSNTGTQSYTVDGIYAYTFKRSLSAQSSAFESVTQLPADIIMINLGGGLGTRLALNQVLTMRQQSLARSCLTPCTASPFVPSLQSPFSQRYQRSIISLTLLTAGEFMGTRPTPCTNKWVELTV